MEHTHTRLCDLLGIKLPIIQAPMTGYVTEDMVVAVGDAGGLGVLPATLVPPAELPVRIAAIRRRTSAPVAVNFLCHDIQEHDPKRESEWRTALLPFYREFGITPAQSIASHAPTFDDVRCSALEDAGPDIVTFHFGLPPKRFVDRLKAIGAKLISTATTVPESRWLEANGCDAIIAQGTDAGGHRGSFLGLCAAQEMGTMALVPQVVDAVSVPVIAAGGIGDGRGIAAALALGADGVQLGTAYLRSTEANISRPYSAALRESQTLGTTISPVFTGRPARVVVNRAVQSLTPFADKVPAFPFGMTAIGPLASASMTTGSPDFMPLWAGQAASLGDSLPAHRLTKKLAEDAQAAMLRAWIRSA